mmetsp:Transcript_15730/g.47234  ORF Transcript_15730/g.47234 Transcript_15730/m.47234 type:complete len:177 (+) Transcript_15730:735-1265(+)
MKLRAETADDARAWADALRAWADHAAEHDGLSGHLGTGGDAAEEAAREVGDEPAPLAGPLAVKKTHKYRADAWVARHAVVDAAAGALCLYKDASAARAKATPDQSFDLRLVHDLAMRAKGDTADAKRFDFRVADARVKVRAGSRADADRWLNGLGQWQDFLLLRGADGAPRGAEMV